MTATEERSLPAGWKWAKLADICIIKGGKRLPAGTDFALGQTPYPYIRVVDFERGSVRKEQLKYVDEVVQKFITRYIITRDDVYISIAGSIGIVGTIPDELHGAQLTENAARLVITDQNRLDRDFLAKYLQSPIGQEAIALRTNQVGQPKLALERIATINFPLPPFPEQKRIAALLTEQLTAVDRARAAAEAQLQAAKQLPGAFLSAVFNSAEAKQWPKVRLGQVCTVHPGQHILEENYNRVQRGIGYLTGPADFGKIQPTITKWTDKPKAWSIPGDILVTVKGAGVGKANIAPDAKVAISRQIMAVRSKQHLVRQLYLYSIVTTHFLQLQGRATGSTIPGLGREDIEQLLVPLPSLADQQHIETRLFNQKNNVEVAQESIQAQLDAINQLPATLLRQAFSGEI